MAYVNKYRIGYSSKLTTGYIYIAEDGYGGGISDLILRRNTFSIRYKFRGWEDPIIGLVCSFDIHNDGASFFTLLPLLTAEELQYKVRVEQVTPSAAVLFDGYMNSRANETPYLKRQPIRITSSSYLSKLRNVYPAILDTDTQDYNLLKYIDDTLRLTGATADIWINSKLYSDLDVLTGNQTLFHKTKVVNELFHKNNVDREDGLAILRIILTAFDCYIYWFNDKWYIERYEDIYNATQTYISYTSGVAYGYSDTGGLNQTTDAALDIASVVFQDRSQTIKILPGMKEVEINLSQKEFINLTTKDLSGCADIPTADVKPQPDLRTFENSSGLGISYLYKGQPYQNIGNSVKRNFYNPISGEPKNWHEGLYTNFRVDVSSESVLTISWKHGYFKNDIGGGGSWTGNWSDYRFRFYWYLRQDDLDYYLMYNSGTDTWTRESKATEALGINYFEVEGTSFDPDNATIDNSITIPIGAISGVGTGIKFWTLCIGTDSVNRLGAGWVGADKAYIGNVFINSSIVLGDNHLSGKTGNKFIDKISIDLDLFDAPSWNFRNALIGGAAADDLTSSWTLNGVDYDPLAERKMRHRFQLYRISRQVIVGTVRSAVQYKPLYLGADTNQSGKEFLLTSYTRRPERDTYDMEFSEYDNSETINFV